MSALQAAAAVSACDVCGADVNRALAPFEVEHRRTTEAVDDQHLAPGAEQVSVNITREGRIALNRLRLQTGISVAEQIRRALDLWLPLQGGGQ